MPYVWSLAVAQGGIPFSLPAIQLFTPTGARDRPRAAGAGQAAAGAAPGSALSLGDCLDRLTPPASIFGPPPRPTVVPDTAGDELSPRNLDTARTESADGGGAHLPGTRSAALMAAGGEEAAPSPV